MKTTEIVGFKRENLGTKYSKLLRADGNVPCVLYGGEEVVHFHAPAYLFKDLIYTPDAYIVHLNVEGLEKRAVIQDAQFHPVSDTLLHCDFLEVFDDKPVTMEIPVKLEGKAPGVEKGGQIYIKNKKLKVRAVPAQLPDYVIANIDELDLGNSFRVQDLNPEGYEIMNKESVAIVQIIVPRALKAAGTEEEGEEGEEGTEEEGTGEE